MLTRVLSWLHPGVAPRGRRAAPAPPTPEAELGDRSLLSALSRLLPVELRRLRLVSPRTMLRWHAHLIARRWTYWDDNRAVRPSRSRSRALVLSPSTRCSGR
jgi:hypothetical protein